MTSLLSISDTRILHVVYERKIREEKGRDMPWLGSVVPGLRVWPSANLYWAKRPISALGGTGITACSGDILLESLVACAGVTLSQIARAMEIELRDAVIRAEGDLDFRGSLGLSEDAPVGLERIRLHFDLQTNANVEEVTGLIRLTERYCVVSRTLSPRAEVTTPRVSLRLLAFCCGCG